MQKVRIGLFVAAILVLVMGQIMTLGQFRYGNDASDVQQEAVSQWQGPSLGNEGRGGWPTGFDGVGAIQTAGWAGILAILCLIGCVALSSILIMRPGERALELAHTIVGSAALALPIFAGFMLRNGLDAFERHMRESIVGGQASAFIDNGTYVNVAIVASVATALAFVVGWYDDRAQVAAGS